MDPYRVLGLTSRLVPHSEIRAAYLKLAKQWHPDAHPPHKQSHATHQFKLISQAWDLLGTPAKRREWDARHYNGVRGGPSTHSHRYSRNTGTYHDAYQHQQYQQRQQYYAEHDVHMRQYSWREKTWGIIVLMAGVFGVWWYERVKEKPSAGVDVLVPAYYNRTNGQWQRAPPDMFNSRDPFIISLIEYKPLHMLGTDGESIQQMTTPKPGAGATQPNTSANTSSTSHPPGTRAYQLPLTDRGVTAALFRSTDDTNNINNSNNNDNNSNRNNLLKSTSTTTTIHTDVVPVPLPVGVSISPPASSSSHLPTIDHVDVVPAITSSHTPNYTRVDGHLRDLHISTPSPHLTVETPHQMTQQPQQQHSQSQSQSQPQRPSP